MKQLPKYPREWSKEDVFAVSDTVGYEPVQIFPPYGEDCSPVWASHAHLPGWASESGKPGLYLLVWYYVACVKHEFRARLKDEE